MSEIRSQSRSFPYLYIRISILLASKRLRMLRLTCKLTVKEVPFTVDSRGWTHVIFLRYLKLWWVWKISTCSLALYSVFILLVLVYISHQFYGFMWSLLDAKCQIPGHCIVIVLFSIVKRPSPLTFSAQWWCPDNVWVSSDDWLSLDRWNSLQLKRSTKCGSLNGCLCCTALRICRCQRLYY